MPRKPGKPIRRKRTTKATGDSKAGAQARRGRAIAAPIAAEEPELDLAPEAVAGDEIDTPIEVSEFHPIESTDEDAATTKPVDGAEVEAGAAKDSGALVATDPLGRYLAEIRRFPLLTREEEAVIARRYVKGKDPQDAYRLVTANLRVVV